MTAHSYGLYKRNTIKMIWLEFEVNEMVRWVIEEIEKIL